MIGDPRVFDPRLHLPVLAQAQGIEVGRAGQDGVVGQDDLGVGHLRMFADVGAGAAQCREPVSDGPFSRKRVRICRDDDADVYPAFRCVDQPPQDRVVGQVGADDV